MKGLLFSGSAVLFATSAIVTVMGGPAWVTLGILTSAAGLYFAGRTADA